MDWDLVQLLTSIVAGAFSVLVALSWKIGRLEGQIEYLKSMMEAHKISAEALEYARANSEKIVKKYLSGVPKVKDPKSIFMAGAPGAGKTDVSKRFLENLSFVNGEKFMRIDPDELRKELPGYDGENADSFQEAATFLADKLHLAALKSGVNFVWDGTFSKLEIQKQNIDHSLQQDRLVVVIYVHQTPKVAWRFVWTRQKTEGRSVPRAKFITKYIESRNVANALKEHFGNNIRLNLVIKDGKGNDLSRHSDIDSLDNHLEKAYNKDELKKILGG